MSKFTKSHNISDIKDLRILTFYKKVYSSFLYKSKFDFFLRFPEKNVQRLLKLGNYNYSKVSINKNLSDDPPRIQICQPVINQMRRSMKKLPKNGEKRSQNRENLHKAIYVNFLKKKLLSPTQGLFKWNVIFWITQNLGHLF